MKPPQPLLVADLFPELLEHLLGLLSDLPPGDWERPTPCPGWTVHDLAAHLLGDDISQLARRDGHRGLSIQARGYSDLVDALNRANQAWVDAARRISPRLLVDLLEVVGAQADEYLASLDPFETGPVVSWAGPDPAPMWLHVAREYTERWLHQQQIRDAVGRAPLYEPRLFAPALAAFVYGAPRAFASERRPRGTAVSLAIEGDAGGRWLVASDGERWGLYVEDDVPARTAAEVAIEQGHAWRLFTRGLTKEEARARARIEGDVALGVRVLDTVSVIV